MTVNKAIILGNLGTDPELRVSKSSIPVCTFSVATDLPSKSGDGQRQRSAEWHKVVCFGITAQNCAKFLSKGREVFVEGRIQSQRWKDDEGKEHFANQIVASTVQFIGRKPVDVTEQEPVRDGLTFEEEIEIARDESIPW